MTDQAVMDPNTEFECKYRVDAHVVVEFKKIAGALSNLKSFLYVEGPDFYYSHPDFDERSFGRYRRPSFGLDGGRAEWTVKRFPKGAKNGIKRLEMNWRVDQTPEEDVKRGAEVMGFVFNFSIIKSCQIYKLDDATLVFYTVYDVTDGATSSKVDHFIEIEVREDMIVKGLTEEQAWAIIEKYEEVLAPVGVTAKKRLRLQLWDMYRREIK